MGKKSVLITKAIVISLTLVIFTPSFTRSGFEDSYTVYGLIKYSNGLPAPNGIIVTFTNLNNGGTTTETTKTSATNISGLYYLDDVYIIGGTNAGDVVRINVSYGGNTGNATFTVGTAGGERIDITLYGNLPPNPPDKPSGPDNVYTLHSHNFFTNTIDNEADQIQYKFDWGDGAFSEWTELVNSGENASQSHTWNSSGVYRIRVKAKDEHGAEIGWSEPDGVTGWSQPFNVTVLNTPPSADFTYNYTLTKSHIIYFSDTSIDPDGSVVSWQWDFGDGNTSTDQSPTHRYELKGTYNVTLEVTDNEGATNITSKSVTVVNSIPVANFTHSPINPTDLDLIQFSDASTDSDGSIVNWLWDFGDGNTSIEQNPTHRFADNGTYTVTLTVKDNENATSTISRSLIILNVAPIASFSYSPPSPTTATLIHFTDQSTDKDGYITSYYWEFGDEFNSTSTEQNPTHRFYSPGYYQVNLTVTDDDGDINYTSLGVNVAGPSVPPPNIPPTAKFTYVPKTPFVNSSVYFMDESKDIYGYIVSYQWDFGDGTNSTDQNPIHRYTAGGTYTVTLTVIDNSGDVDTIEKTIHVLTGFETTTVNLRCNAFNQGENYIIWKGVPTTASSLVSSAGLSNGESISIFNKTTGKWKSYTVGVSTPVDDFNISTWDVIIIKCLAERKIEVDVSGAGDKTQTVKLEYTFNPETRTGNPGYNYIVWSVDSKIKASELAEIINLSRGQSISKLNPETNRWSGYIVGISPARFDFVISKDDILCIKVSQERELKM